MRINVSALSKKAVDATLAQRWSDAVALNREVLDKDPTDKDAKMRLGRAYMQTNKYVAAKKLFKEVLSVDPINSIASKNYKLASQRTKIENNITNPKSLLKEPGKTIQIQLPLKNKNLSFVSGEQFNLRINKETTSVYKNGEKIAVITDIIAKKMYEVNQSDGCCTANFVKQVEEKITLLIKCSRPVFRGEKQHEKPYIKLRLEDPEEVEDEYPD